MIFAIVSLTPLNVDALSGTVIANFPDNYFQVSPDKRIFLVSAAGTAKDVSDRLGISEGALNSAVVFGISGYYGRAPMNTWEWIAAKLAAPSTAVRPGV
jgi:hypothetical protein